MQYRSYTVRGFECLLNIPESPMTGLMRITPLVKIRVQSA